MRARLSRPLRAPAAALLAVAVFAVPLLITPALGATADLDPLATTCTDVDAVFARGSGQDLASDESKVFVKDMTDRISAPATVNIYELGTVPIDGHQYPAVNVANIFNGNAIGAGGPFGAGGSHDYGKSVNEGVAEATAYITSRAATCPETVFVLAGYSQGAQVIGEVYDETLTDDLRERVVFNAMFGDPKLYLPEGRGIWPPACSGREFSPWRRAVANCDVDNGSLQARKPYLPAGWEHNTGLWCNSDDFVCGSTKVATANSGHGKYWETGGPIDEAVIEIVERLKKVLGPQKAGGLDSQIYMIGHGTTGLDVVFLVDSTGSMGYSLSGAQIFAEQFADKIERQRGRVALVEYRDYGDEFVARTLRPLSTEYDFFQSGLAGITASGGGDTPEAALAALMHSFNDLQWRPGATKAAVILTDAGFHNPDVATGVTTIDVAKRALEIDPVNVYTVTNSWAAPDYQELADLTSGAVIVDDGDSVAGLTQALALIEERPVVILPLAAYFAAPGGSIHFDASKSYSLSSTITEFAWDFDGDGTFEVTGTEPTAEHTYPADFAGQMQVRVTTADGGVANHSVPVTISATPIDDGAPAPVTDLAVTVDSTDDATDTSQVTLTWTPADDRATTWLVTVDGVAVGRTDQTSVTLTDVHRGEDVTLGVAGITNADLVGDTAETQLAARGLPTVTPTPAPTPTTPETGPAPVSPPPALTPTDPTVTPPAAPTTTVASPATAAPLPTTVKAAPSPLPKTGSAVIGVTIAAISFIVVGAVLLIRRTKRVRS